MRDIKRTGFDLETLDANRLFTAGKGMFVCLLGYGPMVKEGRALDDPDIRGALESDQLVGCNNFFFDSLALDRHHGIPVHRTIWGNRDLRIAAFQHDPPTSGQTKHGPQFKSYSLDALGERYLNVPKSPAGKQLAKDYGGWDHIPADDPRYVQYCRDDVALTEALDKAIPWDPYELRESKVCTITAMATLNGFRVDVPALTRRVEELAERSRAGRTLLSEVFGFPTLDAKGKPAAAPQRSKLGKAAFETALEAAGFPVDLWPRGKDGSLAQGKETMAYALGHAERNVPAAADVIRAVSEMNGLRNSAANLLSHVVGDRVHYPFEPFQTTGRWSCGLTVLKKGVADSERMFLLPDNEDHVLVSIDLDQIDIRCVAAHSQDHNLLDIMNDPTRDIHQEVADLARVNRSKAKTLDLGWLYGRTVNGLAKTEGMDYETARQVDASMRSQFVRVMQWQNEVRQLGEDGILLDNGFGRHLRVDPDRAFTQAPAMIGQGTTRDLIAEGLIDLAHKAPDVVAMLRVIVHDEVVASVPRKNATEIAVLIQGCMSREWAPAGKSRPVRVTAGQGKPFTFGENWAELYV